MDSDKIELHSLSICKRLKPQTYKYSVLMLLYLTSVFCYLLMFEVSTFTYCRKLVGLSVFKETTLLRQYHNGSKSKKNSVALDFKLDPLRLLSQQSRPEL